MGWPIYIYFIYDELHGNLLWTGLFIYILTHLDDEHHVYLLWTGLFIYILL